MATTKMITINGFPKSGNHALWKACCLLGIPTNGVHHISSQESLPEETSRHVFIRRDPRNVIISWLRFRQQPVTQGTFLTAFRGWQDGRPLIQEMGAYEGWLTHPATLVIQFEKLIASDIEIRRIAEYCQVPYIDGAWQELPGLTKTWTGKYSDFKDIWTEHVADAWETGGGNEFLARWGYQAVALGGI